MIEVGPNFIARPYRGVSVQDAPSLEPERLLEHLRSRRVYRRTEFIVAVHGDDRALVHVGSAQSGLGAVRGPIDLVFADADTPLPPRAVSTVIGQDRYAIVMRESHPSAHKKWTMADYGKWDSVVVSIFGDGTSSLDARLATSGVVRRIGLSTPHFMAVLATVAGTDMVATTSMLFAKSFAKAYRLRVSEVAFLDMRLSSTIVGSSVRMSDPVMKWFCNVVRIVSEDVRKAVFGDKSASSPSRRTSRLTNCGSSHATFPVWMSMARSTRCAGSGAAANVPPMKLFPGSHGCSTRVKTPHLSLVCA